MLGFQVPSETCLFNRILNPKWAGYKFVIPFGKHKGKTVRTVLDTDPDYIIWLDGLGKNLNGMPRVSKHIVRKAEEAVQERDCWNGPPPEDWMLYGH
jgi:hypothetical protein